MGTHGRAGAGEPRNHAGAVHRDSSLNSALVSHHLLLCATPTKAKCCDPTLGAQTWNELKRVVRELNLENIERPEGIVLRSKAKRIASGCANEGRFFWSGQTEFGTPMFHPLASRESLNSTSLANNPLKNGF